MATILLVDEDGWARGELAQALGDEPRLAGALIRVADDAAGALASFRAGRPHAVVIDLTLPDDPGDVLAAALRREPGGDDVSLAFVSSGRPGAGEVARLAQAFRARHFAKPHQVGALVAHLAQLLAGGEVPAPAAPRAPAQQGDLAARPLPAVLFDLLDAEATGKLVVRRGEQAKEITLIDGHPHGVATNARDETLGHFLVSRRVITREQHREAVARAAAGGAKLGETLIALGALDAERLLAELAAQARHKLERTLRWPDGTWAFTPAEPTGARGDAIDLIAAVLEGLRHSLTIDPAPPHLGGDDRAIRLAPRAIRLMAALAAASPGFVGRVRDGESIASLTAAGIDRLEIVAALDALVLSGAARLEAPGATAPTTTPAPRAARPAVVPRPTPADDGVPEPVAAEDSGAIELPRDAPVRFDPEVVRRRQEVLAEYLRVQGGDLYAALGLPRDVAVDAIPAAAAAKLARFARAAIAPAALGRDYGKLEELEALFRRAAAVLGDPAARRSYDDAIASAASVRPAGMALEVEVREAEREAATGRHAEAIARLERVVAAAPHDAAYRTALAGLLGQRPEGRAAALDHLAGALRLDPDHASALELRGALRLAVGDAAGEDDLQRALALDPARPAALDELARHLRARGDLPALDRCYRAVLFRLGARDPAFAVELWRRVAALQRDDLAAPDAARAALRAALAVTPTDATLRAELADLEVGTAERFHQRMLEVRAGTIAGDLTSAMALIHAAEDADRLDLAYLTAAVVALDPDAPAEVRERYERHRPRFLPRALDALSDDELARLRHPDDLPESTRLFAALADPARAVWPIGLEDLGATPAPDPAWAESLRLTRDYLAGVLRAPTPPIAPHEPLGADVALAATEPATLLIGPGAIGLDRVELACRLARALSYAAAGRPLAGAYPGRVLRQLVLAAHLAVHGLAPDAHDRDLVAATTAIAALDPAVRASIAEDLAALTRRGRTVNLSRWTRALARTADRAGLLLCGDPAVAIRVTRGLAGDDAARELADFALSPEHLDLRARLGLAISGGSAG